MTTFSGELNLIPIVLHAKTVKERENELLNLVCVAPNNSLILASELCITGYETKCFQNTQNDFIVALQRALNGDKVIAFTHPARSNLAQNGVKFKNEFLFLTQNGIIHTQSKTKLFTPNLEQEIFILGDENEIKPFKFNGIKFGALICFELRFIELWTQLKGTQIVLVPAMWGEARKDAYLSLCKALAIANNCYVVASSAIDLEFAGVFLPTGDFQKQAKFDSNLITQTKRNLGIL